MTSVSYRASSRLVLGSGLWTPASLSPLWPRLPRFAAAASALALLRLPAQVCAVQLG